MLPRPIRLVPADAERYAPLRLRMLSAAPWAFAASPEDDRVLDLPFLRALLTEEENAIVAVEGARGAHLPELVAAAGVMRKKRAKFAHRAEIWGVFVEPARRGEGLGRAVTEAAVELARGWAGVEYVDLGVSADAPEALRLYESLGFRAWGREPEATAHDGRRFDEIHMTLRL
jgi:ribosomal protein S18 acetylase RimI-like enzyme